MYDTKKKEKKKNYYDILEVATDSSDLVIKKAYRRLALQHHPDRNNGSVESTERFQLIGEAFQCLSNPTSRRDHDAYLRDEEGGENGGMDEEFYTTTTTTTTSGSSFKQQQSGNTTSSGGRMSSSSSSSGYFRQPKNNNNGGRFDPYEQFDYLFRQDPFFHEAFKDMDEEFARRFHNPNNDVYAPRGHGLSSTTIGKDSQQGRMDTTSTSPSYPSSSATNSNNNISHHHDHSISASTNLSSNKEGWLPWLLRQCGIEFQMTSVTVDRTGGGMRTTYSSTSSGGSGGRNMADRSRGYITTQKTSETFRDSEGRIVTVQRMQQNGNQIEDQLVNQRLVQRKVNGIIEPVERIIE
jgi:curved DNA-binding protein CbpA